MANTVLITGASRGIGAATARYFGEQGWQVAVHYHEREDLALELVRELREMSPVWQHMLEHIEDPYQSAEK